MPTFSYAYVNFARTTTGFPPPFEKPAVAQTPFSTGVAVNRTEQSRHDTNTLSLRGRLPCLPCFRFALYTALRGVKSPRRRCTASFCLQRWPAAVRRRLFASTNVPQRQNKRFLGYFGVFWLYPPKRPILAYFEAISGLHLAARRPTGQL